jgi:hypothetical protein
MRLAKFWQAGIGGSADRYPFRILNTFLVDTTRNADRTACRGHDKGGTDRIIVTLVGGLAAPGNTATGWRYRGINVAAHGLSPLIRAG